MNKKLIIGAVIGVVVALAPLAVFAATFSNVQFDNGDVTISGTGGSTVNATFHIIVPANQVVENIQTDVLGDSLAPVCTSVGDNLGLQEGTHDITVPVTLPPNTGTYTLSVQGAGIYGGIRSIDCSDNVVGTASFGSALRVVADSSDTSIPTTGSTGDDFWTKLAGIFAAALKANAPAPAPTPTVAQVCTDLGQYSALGQGSTGQSVVQLQGLLLSKGASIPALAAGASFGFFGPQTAAALASVKGQNSCN